jgi:hypothetical protein
MCTVYIVEASSSQRARALAFLWELEDKPFAHRCALEKKDTGFVISGTQGPWRKRWGEYIFIVKPVLSPTIAPLFNLDSYLCSLP